MIAARAPVATSREVDKNRGSRQICLQNPQRDEAIVNVLERIFNRYYCMQS